MRPRKPGAPVIDVGVPRRLRRQRHEVSQRARVFFFILLLFFNVFHGIEQVLVIDGVRVWARKVCSGVGDGGDLRLDARRGDVLGAVVKGAARERRGRPEELAPTPVPLVLARDARPRERGHAVHGDAARRHAAAVVARGPVRGELLRRREVLPARRAVVRPQRVAELQVLPQVPDLLEGVVDALLVQYGVVLEEEAREGSGLAAVAARGSGLGRFAVVR